MNTNEIYAIENDPVAQRRAELAPLEPAARILCRLDGVDPDAVIPMSHPFLQDVSMPEPQWLVAAGALLNLTRMLTALKVAHNQEQPAQEKLQ